MEDYLGEIRMFAGTFAPRGWAFCNGQEVSISQYSALFSILGTTYGGNGRTTFRLPDLRSRIPIGPGKADDWFTHQIGEKAGVESVVLNLNHLPPHSHNVFPQYGEKADQADPANAYPANIAQPVYGKTNSGLMGYAESRITGNSRPHNNIQPVLGINYIICIWGEYPARG